MPFIIFILRPIARAGTDVLIECALEAAKGWWWTGRFRIAVGHWLNKM